MSMVAPLGDQSNLDASVLAEGGERCLVRSNFSDAQNSAGQIGVREHSCHVPRVEPVASRSL
jgi:hypothetical protein